MGGTLSVGSWFRLNPGVATGGADAPGGERPGVRGAGRGSGVG